MAEDHATQRLHWISFFLVFNALVVAATGFFLQDAIRDSTPRIIIVQTDDGNTYTCKTAGGFTVITDEAGAKLLEDCE